MPNWHLFPFVLRKGVKGQAARPFAGRDGVLAPVPNTQILWPLLTLISECPFPNYNSADHVLWPRLEFYRLAPANPEEIQIAGDNCIWKDGTCLVQNLPGVIAAADMM